MKDKIEINTSSWYTDKFGTRPTTLSDMRFIAKSEKDYSELVSVLKAHDFDIANVSFNSYSKTIFSVGVFSFPENAAENLSVLRKLKDILGENLEPTSAAAIESHIRKVNNLSQKAAS